MFILTRNDELSCGKYHPVAQVLRAVYSTEMIVMFFCFTGISIPFAFLRNERIVMYYFTHVCWWAKLCLPFSVITFVSHDEFLSHCACVCVCVCMSCQPQLPHNKNSNHVNFWEKSHYHPSLHSLWLIDWIGIRDLAALTALSWSVLWQNYLNRTCLLLGCIIILQSVKQ
jgi:hypothetical protein